jgi:hypothetical protein
MKSATPLPKNACRPMILTTTLALAVVSLVLSRGAGDERHPTGANAGNDQLAQGILVQPDAGALEPPAVGGDQDGDDDEDGNDGDDDEGRQGNPAIIEEGQERIEIAPPVPEARQEQLERPGARQTETERQDTRQEGLELPEGRGQKY